MTEKYSIYIRIIHWAMAICIIGLIGVGWYMAGLDTKDPSKYDLYPWHKSFGFLVLILFFVRVALRFTTKIPPLPVGIKKIEKKAARTSHFLLYVFMFLVPLSGYTMSVAGGYGVKFFGYSVPEIFPKDKELGSFAHSFHEYAPYILLAIIVAHVSGALKHRFFDKKENDVIKRMV